MGTRSFSIAGLMRLQFMAALAVGWPLAIRCLQPALICFSFLAIGALLAMCVGWRRQGTPGKRIRSVLLFFSGGLFFASYSAFTAKKVQTPEPLYQTGAHSWATLDSLPAASFIVLGFPLAVAVVTCMLRIWIISIHDRAPGKPPA